jgi:hypothetical protein
MRRRGEAPRGSKRERKLDAPPADQPWVWSTESMLQRQRHLSRAARLCLDRLMVEHMRHGRRENGQLPCTYADFVEWGVRRESIPGALKELSVAGWIRVTVKGGRFHEGRKPSKYALTWLSVGGSPLTSDYLRAPATAAQDARKSRAARRRRQKQVPGRCSNGAGNASPQPESIESRTGNGTKRASSAVPETVLHQPVSGTASGTTPPVLVPFPGPETDVAPKPSTTPRVPACTAFCPSREPGLQGT